MSKVKLKLLLLLFPFWGIVGAYAQTFQWAKRMGAASAANEGNAITTDAAGNSYTTGYFTGTVDFDPGVGVFNLTATATDAFICKLNAAGNFVWAKQISGTGNAEGFAIDIDNSGNVLIAGEYSGTADLDPGAGVFNVTKVGVGDNVFAIKLTSAGNFVWGKILAGSNNVINCSDIGTDAVGNVYLAGTFNETTDFDPGAGVLNLTSVGGTTLELFIVKLSSVGNLTWAHRIGNSTAEFFRDLAIDAAGNVYATGEFRDIVDFNPGAGVFNMNATGIKCFILKLNTSGTFSWAVQIDGDNTTGGTGIAVDGTGYIYVSGGFAGTADLNPSAAVYNVTSAGSWDIYVVKLSPTGNFIWGKRIGGTQSESSFDIALDNLNNLFICGYFMQTVDFNPGAATYNLTSVGNQDSYISKLTSSGNFAWAVRLGSAPPAFIYINSIAVDASFNVYTTGRFGSTIDFNPFAGTSNMTSASSTWDLFILKIGSPSPLPIELLSFNATQNKASVDITWATATETNNEYFTIEKSNNGNEFEDVAKVDGAGNSNQLIEYSFTDKNPYNGLSYYRLKQTDFNGEFSYSKTVAVHVNANNQFLIYQNQTTAQIIVAFKNAETLTGKLTIHDITGRMVYQQQITTATAIINTAFLPGMYVANISDGEQVLSQKFIAK